MQATGSTSSRPGSALVPPRQQQGGSATGGSGAASASPVPGRAVWRNLADFLSRCDHLAAPPSKRQLALPPKGPVLEQRAAGQAYPTTLAEVLGLEGAEEAAAAASGAPALRNQTRVLAALHELTNRTVAGQGAAAQDLYCTRCPPGLRQAECRSGREPGTAPRIGEGWQAACVCVRQAGCAP